MSVTSVYSSKLHPEKCARNSYGQFVQRKNQALMPPPVDLDKSLDGLSDTSPKGAVAGHCNRARQNKFD